ncbi:MAG: beta-galactosidase [Nitrosomonas sp.]|nr:beta-galactosidase [Nitrosomonas sp.]MBP7111385.1 beta-galactosidase [Nitrosomonas sp.]
MKITTSAIKLEINFSFLGAVSMILIFWSNACDASTPVVDSVKWHPGHYYTIMGYGKDNPKYMTQIYNELKKTPVLRGIQVRYLWAELEKTEGVYDFTSIDRQLGELAAQGKRLVIQVQTKSFNPAWRLIPDYLKATKYEGGQFAFSTYGKKIHKGYNIKLWNLQVRDRLSALFRALGERYNSHPYFEGIGMIETALGQPIDPVSSIQIDQFYNNLLDVHRQMRSQFPNTMTIQEVNYPRSILESFIYKLKEMGTGLSSPDIFLDDSGLHSKGTDSVPKGIYHYYPKLSGIVPLAPQVMASNYVNTRHDSTGRRPTIPELLSFAQNRLKANYIFWARSPEDFPKVLEILSRLSLVNDPSGGLDSTCPQSYPSCVD